MESSKISSSQGTHAAGAPRARSASQDGGADGSSGFLALLAALEGATEMAMAPLQTEPGTGQEPADAAAAPGQPAATDFAALAAWQSLLPSQAPAGSDAALVSGAQGSSLRAVSLDGAAGGALPQTLDPQTAAGGPGIALPGADGLPQGLVAETATLDAAAETKAGVVPSAGPAQGKSLARLQSISALKADPLHGPAVPSRTGEPAASPSLAALGALAAGLPLAGDRTGAGLTLAATADRTASATGGTVLEAVGMAASESPMAFSASAGGADGSGAGGRSSGEGRAEVGAWLDGTGGLASAEAPAADGAPVFADPAQVTREDQVAEQVSYWINQKTQNAELTLQRDGQAVEVSVSLTGNEAHVAFRSDQSQTRELLDRSMAQLSELLRSEGLVLSGMSVGTSAGRGGDASNAERQGQSRQGARQAQVIAAVPAGAGTVAKAGALDRAVDVFV